MDRAVSFAFTLVEITIVIVIIATLATIATPVYWRAKQEAEKQGAQEEMRQIEVEITAHIARHGELPDSLAEIGMDDVLDPWGNPYEYTRIAGNDKKGSGGEKWRKDQFLHPINSDYDLYSKGPDGKSTSALTASISRDDIIRANDGAYFGPASEY